MAPKPAKLPLRILLSNDDGIHAPGLKALETIAHELSDDVLVVAPESEQSASSHSLTIARPLRIRNISERRYAIDGSPTAARSWIALQTSPNSLRNVWTVWSLCAASAPN